MYLSTREDFIVLRIYMSISPSFAISFLPPPPLFLLCICVFVRARSCSPVGVCLQGSEPAPGRSMVGTAGLFARSVAAVCLYRQSKVLGQYDVSDIFAIYLFLTGS